MLKRLLWSIAVAGGGIIGLIVFFRPEVCVACASQTPPPTCTANMSAMTLRQADNRKTWWQFLDRREDRTLNVYLGLNMNNGAAPMPYSYELVPTGDWQPAGVTPITGTGTLTPGRNNETIKVTVPYSDTDRGDLQLTANITSPCPFSPSNASSTVRINDQGPTVWPITSRNCPIAGEKPKFRFGLRNPGSQTQTYRVTARAKTQFGGDHTPLLAGAAGPGAQAGEYQFPDVTLGPGKSQELTITCETFGFCLTGSESRVELEVTPAANSAEQFSPATASSNVTLRAPDAICPTFEDWWFIMPPRVFWGMLGTPIAAAVLGAGWYFRPRHTKSFDQNSGGGGNYQRRSRGESVDKGSPQAASGSDGVSWREKL